MKWETTKVYHSWELRPGDPKPGTKRVTVVFAWVPVECVDGTTRWLETVWAHQEFFRGNYLWGWKTVKYEVPM